MPKLDSGWYESPNGNWYSHRNKSGRLAHCKSICEQCGEIFIERKFKGRQSVRHFCSRSCKQKFCVTTQDLSHLEKYRFTKGQPAHNFKGRTRHSAGYWIRTTAGKKVLEHRWLVEQFLGRPLRVDEVVHHINGDKTDNRIENLRLLSPSEHAKDHWNDPEYRKHWRPRKGARE